MVRELGQEEIIDLIDNDTRSYVPRQGVIFSKKRLEKVVNKLLGPVKREKPPKRRKRSLREDMRDFMSEQEKEAYEDEFGPFAAALANDEEKEYFRSRRDEIINSEEFEIDITLDMNIVVMCILDEIMLQRLFKLYVDQPTKAIQSQITDVQRRLRENMRILDATRQQRNQAIEAELERNNARQISLAQIVADLEKSKQLRLMEQREYEVEERDLLQRVALKGPPELDDYVLNEGDKEIEQGVIDEESSSER